ncbi:MAG: sigma-70 family RNA polymerase sigma factor [Nannocystaceae bacterium]
MDTPQPSASTQGARWFAALYRQHFARVHRSASLLGVDPAELEDVAQEVFMIAYRRRRDFDHRRGSERAWLLGISRRVAWRHRRTRARHLRKVAAAAAAPVVREAATAEGVIDHKLARHQLDAFLADLDPDKREAFILGEIEGLSRKELGSVLGVNPSTAYSRLQAARREFYEAFPKRTKPVLEDRRAIARSQARVWLAIAPLLGLAPGTASAAAIEGGRALASPWATLWTSSALARHVIVFTATFVIGASGIVVARGLSEREARGEPKRESSATTVSQPAPPRPRDPPASATGASATTDASPTDAPSIVATPRPASRSSPARVPRAETPRSASAEDPLRDELELLQAVQRELLAGDYERALARLDAAGKPSKALAAERELLRAVARCNLDPASVDAAELDRLAATAVAPALAQALRSCRG